MTLSRLWSGSPSDWRLVNQWQDLQVEEGEAETEEKGGGEGTHLGFHPLPQQTFWSDIMLLA